MLGWALAPWKPHLLFPGLTTEVTQNKSNLSSLKTFRNIEDSVLLSTSPTPITTRFLGFVLRLSEFLFKFYFSITEGFMGLVSGSRHSGPEELPYSISPVAHHSPESEVTETDKHFPSLRTTQLRHCTCAAVSDLGKGLYSLLCHICSSVSHASLGQSCIPYSSWTHSTEVF